MGRVAEKSPGRTRLRRRWISLRREGCEEKERPADPARYRLSEPLFRQQLHHRVTQS